jgi:uncharacterized protein (DUF1800 family)
MKLLIRSACACLALIFTLKLSAQVVVPEVTVFAIDADLREDWPDPAVLAFRRSSSTGDLTVNFTITGSALRGSDYATAVGNSIVIPDGEREAWLYFNPQADALSEATESIVTTLQPDLANYSLSTVAARKACTIYLGNASASRPGAKAAARFLLQAAFGPSGDSTSDADIIPQNVQSLMSIGYEAWLTAEFSRKLGLHQPYLDYMVRAKRPVYADAKQISWWNRVMGVSTLYPGGVAQTPDPLRQRVAFALSQILVISDRNDALAGEARGMTNFYDLLLRHSFGNYRELLYQAALHPCMGAYLSHLYNRKADVDAGTFPDENFAREIMQLFSIGLWQLNADGTRTLDGSGNPIPTYTNADITEFARVFTGLSYGGKGGTSFWWAEGDYLNPMRGWDQYHDLGAKTLLNGVSLPAHTATIPDKGTATMLDIRAATDCLFNHPNTGPFICKQLIQRLVTSNPSPAYVGRVAAVFANNGKAIRGDLKAVVRAILMDAEARDPAMTASATFGKLREPYLRAVNLVRAFNARATIGRYELSYLDGLLFQQPMSSPSVFNFFRPGYSPAGPISDANMVAPEFQVVHAISALSVPNYFFQSLRYGFNRWGHTDVRYLVKPQLTAELALINDIPALMRRLDLVMTGGTLPPEQHQIIREAVEAIPPTMWDYKNERIQTAIYLIAGAPEFGVQR